MEQQCQWGPVSPVPIISFEMAQRTRVDTSGDYFTEVWRQPMRPGVFLSYFTAMWSQGYVGETFSFLVCRSRSWYCPGSSASLVLVDVPAVTQR